MPEHQVDAMPTWIGFFSLALCGLVAMGAVLIAIVAGLLMRRRGGEKSRELADLREENARLREELDRLKKGAIAGSTDIRAII